MKNKGFTILEILVVISVIAILIGIAIPRFQGMQMEANIIKAKAEMKTIQAAMESYKNQGNAYSVTLTDYSGATPQIINAGMTDPFLADAYEIGLSPDNVYYVIYAASVDEDDTASVANTGVVTKSAPTVYCVTNGTNC